MSEPNEPKMTKPQWEYMCIFNPLAGNFCGKLFRTYPKKKLTGTKGHKNYARYWLVKETPTNQNRADLIWTQHGGNTITLWQKCIVNGCKIVQVASNGVTMHGEIVYFSGSGSSLSRRRHTQEKSDPVVSYLHDSLWSAESGFRLPNETNYLIGNFPNILKEKVYHLAP